MSRAQEVERADLLRGAKSFGGITDDLRALRIGFDRPVTDEHRKALLDAINLAVSRGAESETITEGYDEVFNVPLVVPLALPAGGEVKLETIQQQALQHLPDCMMPDGGEPCAGYRWLLDTLLSARTDRDGVIEADVRLTYDKTLRTIIAVTPGGARFVPETLRTAQQDPRAAPIAAEQEPPNTWRWKRTRDIGVSINIWPFNWHFGVEKFGDFYSGSVTIGLGPFFIRIDGNASTGLFGQYDNEVEP